MCGAFNNDLMNRFPLASGRPPSKTFQPFTKAELLAFIGIFIVAGVHIQNKENLNDMCESGALPLVRAAMFRGRLKMMLKFIRFDNKNTRAERAQTDEAAPIQDIWIILKRNLEKAYTSLINALPLTNNYFPLEVILNLHSTYHLNLLPEVGKLLSKSN